MRTLSLLFGRDFCGNEKGNFGMMTALLMPVLIGVAGIAIDTTNLALSKRQLQDATDGAALAVSSALVEGKADATTGQTLGKNFVSGQLSTVLSATDAAAVRNATNVAITTSTSGTSKSYSVVVTSSSTVILTPLTSLLAGKTMTVGATSTAAGGTGPATLRNGISMELVLDESTSMAEDTTTVKSTKCILALLGICLTYQTTYVTKMEALKQATVALFDALDKSDPNTKYIRTGVISYTHVLKRQSPMEWGTARSRTELAAIPTVPPPGGGTDATAAVQAADDAIRRNQYGTDAESVAHAKKNGTDGDRSMILMTDGEMTGSTVLWSSSIDQAVRTKCAAAKAAGIKIYSVAFMAPDRGKALLKYCASSEINYYEPNTMDALIASFTAIADSSTKSTTRLTN